ncbi:hypothetical protein DPMN_150965 [Dreissena polymorpha]|uniref:Ig-like domain-containing protein n=1 Tax=Dreissena polymorpha TaxID=45954 RepID=A0A9D4FIZ5_DREPO|nr:hypothetical protein DPMN_150965 [Dreissena polymorpha]
MSTFIWIVFIRGIVLTSTQPAISPEGSVVVKERSNLTLTCSYKGKPVDKDTICVWSEIPIGKNHRITRLQLTKPRGSICTEFVHYKKLYGYQCSENNVFTITLYNVSRENNGTQWICEMMFVGEAAAQSNIVTLLVKDTAMNRINLPDSNINSSKAFYTTKDFSISPALNESVTITSVSNTSSDTTTEQSEVDSDTPGVSHRDISRLETYIIIGIAACSIVCIIIGIGATYIVVRLKASRRPRRHVSNTNIESDINTVEGQNQLRSSFT